MEPWEVESSLSGCIVFVVVCRLKSVGALEIEFVAPIPEQIVTTTMHFSKVSGEPY